MISRIFRKAPSTDSSAFLIGRISFSRLTFITEIGELDSLGFFGQMEPLPLVGRNEMIVTSIQLYTKVE